MFPPTLRHMSTSTQDRWSPSPLQRAASAALADRLRASLADDESSAVDRAGYAAGFSDNLLPHLGCEQAGWVATGLEHGDGGELDERSRGRRPKAHAAHSSAALAGNTFAGFHGHVGDLALGGLTGFRTMRLEAQHHPLPPATEDRRPANLDVELTGPGIVVGVESKLTEHLGPHGPDRWRWEYRRTETLAPLPEPWRDAIRRRTTGPAVETFLGAQQLLKHALALARAAQAGAFGRDPVDLHLVYLYWEPADGDGIDEVRRHRAEVEAFAAEVAGAGPRFRALTHRELWEAWEQDPGAPAWLAGHVAQLRQRYDVAVGDGVG